MTEINLFKHSKDAFEVEPGHELFREGEAGDVMYVVIEGGVDVRHADVVIETIGPGGIIGELALDRHHAAQRDRDRRGAEPARRASARTTSCSSCRNTRRSRCR